VRTYIASVVSDFWSRGEYVKIRASSDEDAMRLAHRYTRYRSQEDENGGAWPRTEAPGDWRTEALRRVPLDTSAFQGRDRAYVFDRSDIVYDGLMVIFRPIRRSERHAAGT
jgi:hypothetical protein